MTENETNETPKPKKKKRQRSPYQLNLEQWKLAKQIMTELDETHHAARHQIARTVRFCGMEFAEQLFQETLEIEANGGLLTVDGTRRRTPGGVFFYLGRSRMTDKQRKQVFTAPKKKSQSKPADEVPATTETEESAPKIPPTSEAEPAPPAPLSELPPEAEERFAKLQLAADQFRRKIAAIEAGPEDQQFMLALTRKMLRNTENQIAELLKPYSA